MTLHQRLHSARIAQKLTLEDVEKLSGGKISDTHLYNLEAGILRYASPPKLRAISKVLKIPFLELLVLAKHVTIRDLQGGL